jgi:hypothetical protein
MNLQKMDIEKVSKGLGLFSLGLGAVQLLTPKVLERVIGVRRDHSPLVRFLGAREIAAGIGIFASTNPAPWLWARVAGDVMDLGLLGAALKTKDNYRLRLGIATLLVIAVAALDYMAAKQASE